jgi:hypothetical protein
MKIARWFLCFSMTLGTMASAEAAPKAVTKAEKRAAGEAPAISLTDAIVRAVSYAKTNKLDQSRQYIQSAMFNVVTRAWTVTWQVPNAKGGTTWIVIPEAGDITVSYGE